MRKCEWKDGKLKGCKNMVIVGSNNGQIRYSGERVKDLTMDFCPFCGAAIGEPEPEEPIIKKSGETWVARYEGINYFYAPYPVHTQLVDADLDNIKRNPSLLWCNGTKWKPISEIEITDEIAKLRPMVFDRGSKEKLYAVDDGKGITSSGSYTISCYRIATVNDL